MANASNFTRGFTPASNPERGNNIWVTKWAFIYTIICLKSVTVRKLRVAILARSSREMSLTDRIVWKHTLSRVRVSVRPRIVLYAKKKTIVNTESPHVVYFVCKWVFAIGRKSPLRTQFYSDHRVNVSAYRYCQSATVGPLAFCVCSLLFSILNQKEFRIATSVAMFTSGLNAGVVPQMSPPPHDIERLLTTIVDFIVLSIKLVFMAIGVHLC